MSTDPVKLVVNWVSFLKHCLGQGVLSAAIAVIQAINGEALHSSSARHGDVHVLKVEQALSWESSDAINDATVLEELWCNRI